ncbi:MAG: hypothetical protein ACRCW2_14740 [Cellulosilyticaceae bacterium]
MQQWGIGAEPWGRAYFEEQGFQVTDQIVLRNLIVYIDKNRECFFPVVEKDIMRERKIYQFNDVKEIVHRIKYDERQGMPQLQKSWLVVETTQKSTKYMITIEDSPNLQMIIKSEGDFGISKLKAYVDGKILYGKKEPKVESVTKLQIPVKQQAKSAVVLTRKQEHIQNGMWLLYAGLAALLFSMMNIGFWGWGEQTQLIVMILGSFGILATAWGTKWVLLTPLEKYVVTENSIRKYGMMSLKIIKYRELRVLNNQMQQVAVFSKGVLKIHTPDEILVISKKDYELEEIMRFIHAFEIHAKMKVTISD